MILLDTCTLLWLADDRSQLSQAANELILKNRNNLFVSAACGFELGIKYQKKKLLLDMDPQKWFEGTLKRYSIKEIPITSKTAIYSTNLPPIHQDPCDRILVATSKIEGMIILTPDQAIQQYREANWEW